MMAQKVHFALLVYHSAVLEYCCALPATGNFLIISAHFMNDAVEFLDNAAHFLTPVQLNSIFP